MKTEITIKNLKLKNPVLVASGTFGYAKEFSRFVNLKKLGGVITKTITLKPKQGNSPPRIIETAAGMVNAIGLQNEGIKKFLKEKMTFLRSLGVPIIVSMGADTTEEYIQLVEILNKTQGVSAIELNISCPNIKVKGKQCLILRRRSVFLRHAQDASKDAEQSRSTTLSPSTALGMVQGMVNPSNHKPQLLSRGASNGLISQDADATYQLVKRIRSVTKKTLIIKLSPNVTDIVTIAKAAQEAGSDAVSLVNTFLAMSIDIQRRAPRLGNVTGGLSGPAIKPIALRMVWQVAKALKIPVIGMGGIMNADDALEFIIAGASAVCAGTVNLVDPAASVKIIKGIEDYLKKNKVKDIKELIGCLQQG